MSQGKIYNTTKNCAGGKARKSALIEKTGLIVKILMKHLPMPGCYVECFGWPIIGKIRVPLLK
jgi:hypothetical protein